MTLPWLAGLRWWASGVICSTTGEHRDYARFPVGENRKKTRQSWRTRNLTLERYSSRLLFEVTLAPTTDFQNLSLTLGDSQPCIPRIYRTHTLYIAVGLKRLADVRHLDVNHDIVSDSKWILHCLDFIRYTPAIRMHCPTMTTRDPPNNFRRPLPDLNPLFRTVSTATISQPCHSPVSSSCWTP